MSITAQFTLGTPSAAARRCEPGATPRILLMGDWLGASASVQPLGQRKLWRIDIDNFETVMQQLAPSLDLADYGRLHFHSLDDFHPDTLCQRSELLRHLLDLYRNLDNPTHARALAAKLSAATETPTPPPAASESSSDFEHLLGGKIRSASPAPKEDHFDQLLRELVAAHIVDTRATEPYRQATALTLGKRLCALLHQPSFQSLEAHWRGLWWLLTHIDNEALEVRLLPLTHAELRADLLAAGDDLAGSGLYPQLFNAQGEPTWALLSGCYTFSATVADIHNLAGLGTLANAAGAPFVAAADPALLGCMSPTELADPQRWQPLDPTVAERWQALRSSVVAPWLCLALPDILLRQPYGQRTDRIESFAFEEQALESRELLWGSAAWGLTMALGQCLQAQPGDGDPSLAVTLEDLPVFSHNLDGETALQSGTAAVLSERAAQAIAQSGLTPILGYRNRAEVRLPGCIALSGTVPNGV